MLVECRKKPRIGDYVRVYSSMSRTSIQVEGTITHFTNRVDLSLVMRIIPPGKDYGLWFRWHGDGREVRLVEVKERG